MSGIGIEELFKNIGNKLLDPDYEVVGIEHHKKEIDGFYIVEYFKLEEYKDKHSQKNKERCCYYI